MTDDSSIVVLTGAGIQDSSWEPVLRALRASFSPRVTNADQANAALANIVYNRRFATQQRLESNDQMTTDLHHDWTVRYGRVVQAIADELALAEANGELRIRESFKQIWNAHVQHKSAPTIITTNWDRTLATAAMKQWSDVDENVVFHLHGDRRNPQHLLLPTEVVDEPYRSKDDEDLLGWRLIQLVELIEKSDRMLIAGLGLSALDAELSHAVCAGIDGGTISEVIIANTVHAEVAGRLMVLLQRHQPRIFGCHPDEPATLVEHEWPALAGSG